MVSVKKKTAVILGILLVLLVVQNKFVIAKSKREIWESAGIIWNVKTKNKWVALTFDDGPHPVFTKTILNILDKHQAKATFFVVGKMAEQLPSLVLEMKEKGHEIANHTFKHPTLSSLSTSQLDGELKKTDQIIFSITGQHPTLFRPPDGVYNKKIMYVANKNHYRIILYSVDPKDWSNTTPQRITKRVLSNVKPGDIILLHDLGGNRTKTIKALEDIIVNLQADGYRFTTVSELMSNN